MLAGLALLAGGIALVAFWEPGSGQTPETIPIERVTAPISPTVTPTRPAAERRTAASTPATTASEDPDSVGPLLGGDTGLTFLVGTEDGTVTVIDADTGAITRGRVADGAITDVVPRGEDVVTSVYGPGGGRAQVLDAELEVSGLGAADRLLADAEPDRVWLVRGNEFLGRVTMRQVTLDGSAVLEVTLPPRTRPLDAVEEGLILDAAGRLVLYDPVNDEGRSLGDGAAVAANDGHVARLTCTDDLDCALAVGTVEDPDATHLPAPSGVPPYGPPAVFSPDGRYLVLTLYEPLDGPSGFRQVVTVVDTESGEQTRISESAFLGGLRSVYPSWARSGAWLFHIDGNALVAWSPQADELTEIPLPGDRRVTALAVR